MCTNDLIQKIFISKKPSLRSLIVNDWAYSSPGRSDGKITVRHKGGGVFHSYRVLDRKRMLWNIQGVVHSLEYDPGRTARIALIYYPYCKLASYITAPDGLKVGDLVEAGNKIRLVPGNATLLRNLPLRLKIHNLEGHPLGGAKYCRSAGNWAMVISKTNLSAVVMFANGKKKNLSLDCLGTIGVVSNASFSSIKRNKAGYSRLKGIRPSVRGVAMNPVDHPHGGGNGKKSPKSTNMSPWRKLGKGIKTTRNNA